MLNYEGKNAIVSVVMGSDTDLPVMLQCLKALRGLASQLEVLISSAIVQSSATFAKMPLAGNKGDRCRGGLGCPPCRDDCRLTLARYCGAPERVGLEWGGCSMPLFMPKGVPVATVAADGAYNAGVLAAQIIMLVIRPSGKVQQYN